MLFAIGACLSFTIACNTPHNPGAPSSSGGPGLGAGADGPDLTMSSTADSPNDPVRSITAREKGLEVWFEILPGVKLERIPMRTITLHFKNTTSDPIRIYLPQAEAFRANISSIVLTGGADPLLIPEPRPHGYKVSEADFPLIAPHTEITFTQSFSLDPMTPGSGTSTARRKGFEAGTAVKVSWEYENKLVRWPSGAPTLDGPSAALFDGKDIPHLWTGKVSTSASWVAPP